MIDIGQLRIGNYLYNKNEIYHITSITLDIDDEYEESIGFCKLGKRTDEEGGWVQCFGDKVQYIPLTEEWLLKLGYKLVNTTPNFKSFSGEPYVYLNNDGSVKMSTGKEMYYVHELQNRVYSLTGQELTMNLNRLIR